MTATTIRRLGIQLLLGLLLGFAIACDDNTLRPEAPTAPDPPGPAPVRIEYRVNGSIRGLDVTYSNASQGTTFVTADPPWFTTFDTTRARTFVYLSATAPDDNTIAGPLVAQIFVNGELFREATARGVTPTVTVSGEVVR